MHVPFDCCGRGSKPSLGVDAHPWGGVSDKRASLTLRGLAKVPSVACGHVWRASLGVLAPCPAAPTPRDFSEPHPVAGVPFLMVSSPERASCFLSPTSASAWWLFKVASGCSRVPPVTRLTLAYPHTLYSLLSSLRADGASGGFSTNQPRPELLGDNWQSPGPP